MKGRRERREKGIERGGRKGRKEEEKGEEERFIHSQCS